MNGDLKICPQSGYVVAILANLDPQAAGTLRISSRRACRNDLDLFVDQLLSVFFRACKFE